MRWLVRFAPEGSPQDSLLPTMKALARSVGAEARNAKWTSYGGLELDVFCPTAADFQTFRAATEPIAKTEFVTDLNRAQEHLSDAEVLARARHLFNAERYWECHEVLEGLWRQKKGAERSLLQGMILVCAACVHHQKGQDKVAMGVMGRAVKQLDYPMTGYAGIDVSKMKAEALAILDSGSFRVFRV